MSTQADLLQGTLDMLILKAVSSRSVQAMLFGVQPLDPVTLALSVVLMIGVAVLAAWLPARRASRLEPMVALRHA